DFEDEPRLAQRATASEIAVVQCADGLGDCAIEAADPPDLIAVHSLTLVRDHPIARAAKLIARRRPFSLAKSASDSALVPRCWKTISPLSLRRNDRAVVEPALTVGAVADPGGQFPHHRRRAVAESGFVLAVAV